MILPPVTLSEVEEDPETVNWCCTLMLYPFRSSVPPVMVSLFTVSVALSTGLFDVETMVTLSQLPGTPLGVQFPAVVKLVLTAPVQV